jgi:miniconductance mechanosensitive channel
MNFFSKLLASWGVSDYYVSSLSFLICFAIIIAVAYFAHIVFKIYLSRQVNKYLEKKGAYWGRFIIEGRMVHRLSHLVPAIIIYTAAPLLINPDLALDATIIRFIQALMLLYILVACILVFNSAIFIGENVYKRQKGSKRRPIKSYLQVIRIMVYFVALIGAAAIIVNKSPIALFTGIGAMAAILVIIFKDTISSFIASVQLSSYDMVRVGDWVVMPKYGADGDVMEISLNTVKIQNFDKTITTVPTSALLSEGMTNWRGMEEAGGRRIKRSIYIDIKTVKFCDEELLAKLKKLHYLKDYIKEREDAITAYNSDITLGKEDNIANGRHLTNLGLYRAYAEQYVSNHPRIHPDMTLIIRHLQPTELGLPLEIYIFTNDTNWRRYEDIQADIFEHLFPCLEVFDLKIYQR